MTTVNPTYSSQEFNQFRRAAGRFWSTAYANNDVALLLEDTSVANEQRWADSEREVAMESRETIQPLAHRQYVPLIVTDDAINRASARQVTWGSFSWGDGTSWGDIVETLPTMPLAAQYEEVRALVDNPVNPGAILVAGLDFVTVAGALVFKEDPRKYAVFSEDVQQVKSYRFWMLGAQENLSEIYTHYGWTYGQTRQSLSGTDYRTVVNSAWDTALEGPSVRAFTRATAATFAVPTVGTDGEVVQIVTTSNGRAVICTDRASYDAPLAMTPAVAVGDILVADQLLFRDLQIMDGTAEILRAGIPGLATPLVGFAYLISGYTTSAAGAGYGAGDTVQHVQVIDPTSTDQAVILDFWVNRTTVQPLPAAPPESALLPIPGVAPTVQVPAGSIFWPNQALPVTVVGGAARVGITGDIIDVETFWRASELRVPGGVMAVLVQKPWGPPTIPSTAIPLEFYLLHVAGPGQVVVWMNSTIFGNDVQALRGKIAQVLDPRFSLSPATNFSLVAVPMP